MDSTHHHAHEHHHHHAPNITSLNRAFIIGIGLNMAFVVIECIAGFYTHSLALLSDAGHNLSDVAMLGLSLFAFQIAKRKATSRYTYGFHRGTILASLANAVILLIAVGSIGWEAIQRFITPVQTQGSTISIVAGIGIVINATSALLFFKDKETDLNVKGAYLHLALDALVSAGVVIAGLIITYTHASWIDPLISLVIMIVVIYSTWGLLKESLKLSLDAVPKSIHLEEVKNEILKTKGIKSIHHIHIWAMSTTKNAMTAHLILERNLDEEQIIAIKHSVKHALEHLNIQHVTLETELEYCQEESCDSA
ncbi:MAG TPA: cation diffusion facilitator family transporter [Bacteroidia bacterium]|jgi:cobalt-zinc-cadmium efflux system protein|nr:cation diffusion facilitator family transporter [Bacteroidia bacterium]